jgi:prepilin signal peptidase PulO-like enzyme (type II secretory pathway)
LSEYIVLVIKIFLGLALGILAGHASIYIFNKIPAVWLCDYDEEPSDELKDKYTQRVKGYPWRWVLSGFFAVIGVRLFVFDWFFAPAALVACLVLVEIAIADHKYGIIPDQFVILLGIASMGLTLWHHNWIQPLVGLAIGGGAMLSLALIGHLIFRKEVLGFGDVKLFAVLGLLLGIHGTIFVLAASVFSSSIGFGVALIRRKVKKEEMKPMGPYICGTAIFYLVVIWPYIHLI